MRPEFDSIDAVILDLGGVVLDIDYNRTIAAFKALGFRNFEEQYSQMQQSGLFDELETGAINEQGFVEAISKEIPSATKTAIISAWNALLIGFPKGQIKLVKEIAVQRPTFLLSNTNAIHLPAFNELLFNQCGLNDIKPIFKKAYLSHEIGMRKPNPETFELIIEEQGLNRSSTLFVDDSPQHITAARALGIQAYHLTAIAGLRDLFKPILT